MRKMTHDVTVVYNFDGKFVYQIVWLHFNCAKLLTCQLADTKSVLKQLLSPTISKCSSYLERMQTAILEISWFEECYDTAFVANLFTVPFKCWQPTDLWVCGQKVSHHFSTPFWSTFLDVSLINWSKFRLCNTCNVLWILTGLFFNNNWF